LTIAYGSFDEILARISVSKGYVPVRTGVASEKDMIGLDSNENYLLEADLIQRIGEEAARCDLRSYPREEIIELREMLGAWLDVQPECIVLSNGGDQLIDLIATVLLRGGTALTVKPTYSLYQLRSELVGGKLIQIPLKNDFSLDAPGLLSAANQTRASIIFLCSPNNPTGNQFSEADIVEVLRGFRGLVLLDEAYVEFASRSALPLAQKYPNVGVIRTFSKAFGGAGARLGYMVTNPRFGETLTKKVQLPYPISKFSARVGIQCLRHLKSMQDSVLRLTQERVWLISRLRRFEPLTVFDSEANFVLVCTGGDSALVCSKLRSLGIAVKDVGDVLDFRGCLRVTVGTRPMNEKLLGGLEQVIKNGRL